MDDRGPAVAPALKAVRVPEPFAPIFEKAQEYVDRYFQQRRFDPSEGTIEIFGQRYMLVRAGAMSVEFFDQIMRLYEDKGEDEALAVARSMLFDIAHAIGASDGRNFHTRMSLEDPIEKLSAGPVHLPTRGGRSSTSPPRAGRRRTRTSSSSMTTRTPSSPTPG